MSVTRPRFSIAAGCWFGSGAVVWWTAGHGDSFCRTGTESVEGRGAGCVGRDACRWKAGAASSKAAFDACSVVVGTRNPLVG